MMNVILTRVMGSWVWRCPSCFADNLLGKSHLGFATCRVCSTTSFITEVSK